jgi:hypothetical protein
MMFDASHRPCGFETWFDVSIPDQRKQGEAYCASRGYRLAETFVEAGASATNDRRPEFQRNRGRGQQARALQSCRGSFVLALLPRPPASGCASTAAATAAIIAFAQRVEMAEREVFIRGSKTSFYARLSPSEAGNRRKPACAVLYRNGGRGGIRTHEGA